MRDQQLFVTSGRRVTSALRHLPPTPHVVAMCADWESQALGAIAPVVLLLFVLLVVATQYTFTASCKDTRTCRVNFAEEELRKKLSPLEFHVTQEKGTEPAFTGKFAEHKGKGTYGCVVCQAPLFASQAKYDSGSGWPSFYNIIRANAVSHSKDRSHGMHRTEVTCGQCGAHLGHVFDDGPPPTGKRFCINSASLNFNPSAEEEGGAEAVEEAPVKPEL
ncbi:methionine-R-sulfoxide reductase B3 isoform X1 [Petromyzon marinus]|uniref:Peptide-methionine (R)-S-oxide reductase n=1 Tax=Petromyzon marinus TaxID=7757 RepID=A0AAJ7T4N5_PETMA|nr:methionine-R-sulfoxide reductase B3 isoform X1 [Petromyzon marinus]